MKRNAPRSALRSLSPEAYALIFLGVSALGWLFEMIGRYLLYRHVNDRGFLSLPVCPIYGSCVLLAGLLLGSPFSPSQPLAKLTAPLSGLPRFGRALLRILAYWLCATLLATTVELLTGLAFRAVGIPLWSYAERPGNLLGVICPSYSLLWGCLLTLVMSLIWAPLCLLIAKIPERVLKALTRPLLLVLLLDFLFNCLFVIITGERFTLKNLL